MATDLHAPLAGIRVLDVSRVLAGPFCAQVLADLGAEVVKIERPGSGDETRDWGPPFVGPLSAYFLCCNRSKRSVALDLSLAEGRQLLSELAIHSDVLLENFRADSAEQLGLTPTRLLADHPHLIVCSISGFGRSSPMRDVPGYDFAIQAMSGLMSITGPVEGPPCKVGVAVTDVVTGLYAAIAILACLQARKQSGHGYSIDLALLDCAVASQVNLVQAFLASGSLPARQGNAHLQIVPYQLFATADGWLVLAIGNDTQWQRFCRAVQRMDLASDARFTTNNQRVQNREHLLPMLVQELEKRVTASWIALLRDAEIPHAPVWSYADLFSDKDMASRLKIAVRGPSGELVDLVRSPFHIEGSTLPEPSFPPELGKDTDEVLRDILGLDAAELQRLHAEKVIGTR